MATITIRRLDDATVEALKTKAKANGRSMEEEARLMLSRGTGTGKLSGKAAAERFRQLQKKHFGDQEFSDSLEILRELREEDPTGRDWK
ncbi:MAG TPA: hypothetical protein VIJ94_00380 [Caulobacteraceae bacterium]